MLKPLVCIYSILWSIPGVVAGARPNIVFMLADDMGLGDTSAYQDFTGNTDEENDAALGLQSSRKIQRYSMDGTKIDDFVTGLSGPIDQLAFGPDNMLYVTMQSGDGSGIHRFDPSRTYSGDNLFIANKNAPMGITFDPDGDLYVAESTTRHIRKYIGPGKPESGGDLGVFVKTLSLLARVHGLCNLASDSQGNIYAAGYGSDSIGRFDKNGKRKVFAEGTKINNPYGLAFGPDGMLYVSSSGNGNIIRCDNNGEITVIVEGKETGLKHPCQLVFTSAVTGTDPQSQLKTVGDGLVLEGKNSDLRVHFIGDPQKGYDVVFEKNINNNWQGLGSFPDGNAWTVYTDWQDSWYTKPHNVKVQKVASFGKGSVIATASAPIVGEPWGGIIDELRTKSFGSAANYLAKKPNDNFAWQFSDVYSLRHGMI